MQLSETLGRLILVTGHYGSGKTNLSVNLALDLQKAGRNVVLVDLDIVNPYFRSADFTGLLQEHGVEMIAPVFANTNLDVPSLGAGLSSVVNDPEKTVIADVGGDDAGAIALGRYSADILRQKYDMLYVYNYYRYLTRDAEDALEILNQIKAAARVECTAVVNNSNLGPETTRETVVRSFEPAEKLSRLCGLPILFTAVPRAVAARSLPGESLYPVDLYVKQPWQ